MGLQLWPMFPSKGLNITDTLLNLIIEDHDNLKLLRPKTKNWNFDNLSQFGESLGSPNGFLHPKIFHRKFNIANMNASWKFEATKIKDKKFEILTIWTNFESPWGPRRVHTSKYVRQIISYSKYECILKIWRLYGHRQKNCNFDHFRVLQGPKWGAESKFWPNNIFGHGKVSIYWAFENPNSKTEGEVLLSNIGPFRAFWGYSPKTGPNIKIPVQQFFLA